MSVDLEDFIYKDRKDGKYTHKYYHLYCDTCGVSRGYNNKNLSNLNCRSCAGIKSQALIDIFVKKERMKYARSFERDRSHKQETKDKISKANMGKIRSIETRMKNSANKQGIDLDKWEDFEYNKDDPKRSSYKGNKICLKIYERDSYTCLLCKKIGGRLHAHHLDNWSQFKEKRYDFDNIVCLCIKCHRAFHSEYGTRNNTKEQFEKYKTKGDIDVKDNK
jgi:hypothetical protein